VTYFVAVFILFNFFVTFFTFPNRRGFDGLKIYPVTDDSLI